MTQEFYYPAFCQIVDRVLGIESVYLADEAGRFDWCRLRSELVIWNLSLTAKQYIGSGVCLVSANEKRLQRHLVKNVCHE